MSNSLNEILVSVEAMRASFTFPLDPFAMSYLNSSSLTPIQLSPNVWAYLFGFVKYARQVLKVELSVALFWSMFTIETKGNVNCTYSFTSVDVEEKESLRVPSPRCEIGRQNL